jgi:hypothetical protein
MILAASPMYKYLLNPLPFSTLYILNPYLSRIYYPSSGYRALYNKKGFPPLFHLTGLTQSGGMRGFFHVGSFDDRSWESFLRIGAS